MYCYVQLSEFLFSLNWLCPWLLPSSGNIPTNFERNLNLKCNSSRYSHIPNIKSIYQRTSKKKSGQLKIWKKNTSSRAITQPKIIRPERNSNLKCNSSRYNHIPNNMVAKICKKCKNIIYVIYYLLNVIGFLSCYLSVIPHQLLVKTVFGGDLRYYWVDICWFITGRKNQRT
jgi:hypothetical protein